MTTTARLADACTRYNEVLADENTTIGFKLFQLGNLHAVLADPEILAQPVVADAGAGHSSE